MTRKVRFSIAQFRGRNVRGQSVLGRHKSEEKENRSSGDSEGHLFLGHGHIHIHI